MFKHRFCPGRTLVFLLFLTVLTAVCFGTAAEAQDSAAREAGNPVVAAEAQDPATGEARNIAAECKYAAARGHTRIFGNLYDGSYQYYWESDVRRDNWLQVTLPEGETCSGVQIKWAEINRSWRIEVEQDGEWVPAGGYEADYLNTWTPLENVTSFRIFAGKRANRLRINELEVYSAGKRPASVQVWEPTPEKADMIVVIAHPDDEYIFMGAIIPLYGAEKGKTVLPVYITESSVTRRTELLDGLWTAGQRTYPLIGKFYDRYTMSMREAYQKIGKTKVQNYMIEVFRRYKPEIVVTHDINGEYGHGVHRVCADIVINALEKSGNEKIHRESAKAYGTWEVPKCYIHLYGENPIRFDWKGTTLEAFGGKTAFEVADAAWQCHQSQTAKGKYEVYVDGPYDSQVFGLYRSTVGEDRLHNDFFENIAEIPDFFVLPETAEFPVM